MKDFPLPQLDEYSNELVRNATCSKTRKKKRMNKLQRDITSGQSMLMTNATDDTTVQIEQRVPSKVFKLP